MHDNRNDLGRHSGAGPHLTDKDIDSRQSAVYDTNPRDMQLHEQARQSFLAERALRLLRYIDSQTV